MPAKSCFERLTKEQASRVQEVLDSLPENVRAFVYENVVFTANMKGCQTWGGMQMLNSTGKALICLRGLDGSRPFTWHIVAHEIAHAVLGHHRSIFALPIGRVCNLRLWRLKAERDANRLVLRWAETHSKKLTTAQEKPRVGDLGTVAQHLSGGSVS